MYLTRVASVPVFEQILTKDMALTFHKPATAALNLVSKKSQISNKETSLYLFF